MKNLISIRPSKDIRNKINNVIYQEQANWIRIEKQFERLKKNKAIQHFLKKYNYHKTLNRLDLMHLMNVQV